MNHIHFLCKRPFSGILLILLCTMTVMELQAQVVEGYTGINTGRFFNFHRVEGHYSKDFGKPVAGLVVGVAVREWSVADAFKLHAAVQYEQYGGYFQVGGGGLGSHTDDSGSVTKQVLGIVFYPLNLTIARHLQLSAGIQYSALLASHLQGRRYQWGASGMSIESKTTPLEDLPDFVSKSNFGLALKAGYTFNVNRWVVRPQLLWQVGFRDEFGNSIVSAFHQRASLAVGIGYRWKE